MCHEYIQQAKSISTGSNSGPQSTYVNKRFFTHEIIQKLFNFKNMFYITKITARSKYCLWMPQLEQKQVPLKMNSQRNNSRGGILKWSKLKGNGTPFDY